MARKSEITTLIDQFAGLPGLGPRSAQRLVLHLIRHRNRKLTPLLEALSGFSERVQDCPRCGNATTFETCRICTDHERKDSALCVVETVADLWAIERANTYRGLYFVLGGVLSVRDGTGPTEIRIPQLVSRVAEERPEEVILALNATVDSQTTVHFIANQLAGMDVKVTTLGRGVPVGGELDYLDGGTITAAMIGRRDY